MITFWAAILVLSSVGIVSWPLLRGTGGKKRARLVERVEVSELLTQKDAALLAISELESDYNGGSLSQDDYRELRQKYEEKAMSLIKTVDELRSERSLSEASNLDEEIEAGVSRLRAARHSAGADIENRLSRQPAARPGQEAAAGNACPACGASLQADDQFCFRCGAALKLKCPECSAKLDATDRFCFQCGAALSTGGGRRRVN